MTTPERLQWAFWIGIAIASVFWFIVFRFDKRKP